MNHLLESEKIGKLGTQNERKMGNPVKVNDSNGRISTHIDNVINRWKKLRTCFHISQRLIMKTIIKVIQNNGFMAKLLPVQIPIFPC